MTILFHFSMIGIDSEFRSTTNYKQELVISYLLRIFINEFRIALLQVSSQDKVYLVDFELLDVCFSNLIFNGRPQYLFQRKLSKSQWEQFTLRLFGGEHLKIGKFDF